MKLTAKVVLEYQKKWRTSDFTAGTFKSIGNELVEKYDLTPRQAIDIINNQDVLSILASKEDEA